MKKAMKRALLLALAVAMLVCLSACGKCAWEIKINGKDIQIPCTLDDIGEEYEYTLDYPFSGNSNGKGIFSVALMQDGSIIGTVKGMSIAGVKCGDDKTEVKKVFGEPDSPDADAWKYKKRGFLATFFFDDDGKVTMLSISDIDDEDT